MTVVRISDYRPRPPRPDQPAKVGLLPGFRLDQEPLIDATTWALRRAQSGDRHGDVEPD